MIFFSNLGFNLNIIFNSFYHSFDLNDFLHWLFLKISILLRQAVDILAMHLEMAPIFHLVYIIAFLWQKFTMTINSRVTTSSYGFMPSDNTRTITL